MIKIRGYFKLFRRFIFPNFNRLFRAQVIFESWPVCAQSTLITGKGKVHIGNSCAFGYTLGGRFKYGIIEIQVRYEHSIIIFGDNVFTNNNLFICAANKISIGSDTLIGENVTIFDHEAHGNKPKDRRTIGSVGDVIIGKNVWIGNNVTILKNVVIGDNTIIATGAVVTKCFPADVIIGGVPAKIISSLL